MTLPSTLKTERLLLRQWQEGDFPKFVEMGKDADVMRYFPAKLTEKESNAMALKIQSLIHERGWGFWAVELPEQASFIGFVGLHVPNNNLPFSPCVEIGWRLAAKHWGKGYATEAANAALKFAFSELDIAQVVSFTSIINTPSQRVMRNLGMCHAGNFTHPDVPKDSPLAEHVLFKISQDKWTVLNA